MKIGKMLLGSVLLAMVQVACGPAEAEQPVEAGAPSPLLQAPLKLEQAPVQAMGPAPALSYLQVYAVISSNYPAYEYLSANQGATVQDHGGPEMYVVTVEYGYADSWYTKAQMNGMGLTEYRDSTHPQAIVDSSRTVIGWYKWWIANGHESGQFSYQARSINYPWNTMYDQAYVY
jgi:hypothetical protein